MQPAFLTPISILAIFSVGILLASLRLRRIWKLGTADIALLSISILLGYLLLGPFLGRFVILNPYIGLAFGPLIGMVAGLLVGIWLLLIFRKMR